MDPAAKYVPIAICICNCNLLENYISFVSSFQIKRATRTKPISGINNTANVKDNDIQISYIFNSTVWTNHLHYLLDSNFENLRIWARICIFLFPYLMKKVPWMQQNKRFYIRFNSIEKLKNWLRILQNRDWWRTPVLSSS